MIFFVRLKILWLFSLIIFGGVSALRAEELSQEYQLKLAFIVNFARFITWPEEAFTPEQPQLTFCVFGKNPFGNTLGEIEGKKIGERSLTVKRIENFGKEQQCHLAYVSPSEVGSLTKLMQALPYRFVVTVSDSPGFTANGGGIEFVLKEDRLSFIINNTEMKNRGVQAGSALLSLAAAIR